MNTYPWPITFELWDKASISPSLSKSPNVILTSYWISGKGSVIFVNIPVGAEVVTSTLVADAITFGVPSSSCPTT